MARRREDGTISPPAKGGWDPSRMSAEGQMTKVKTGGNAKCDQAFMEDEAENLRVIEELPPGFYWDVKYQWQAHADELDPQYWEQMRRYSRQCTGVAWVRDERGGYIVDLDMARIQRPCMRSPMQGSMVCDRHGGQMNHVREAAQNRLSHAAEKAANTLITLTNPRDDIGEIVDQGVRVKAANSVLDRAGVKAGVDVNVQVPGYQNVLQRMFGDDSEEQPTDG